jgi:hypothetical protein
MLTALAIRPFAFANFVVRLTEFLPQRQQNFGKAPHSPGWHLLQWIGHTTSLYRRVIACATLTTVVP